MHYSKLILSTAFALLTAFATATNPPSSESRSLISSPNVISKVSSDLPDFLNDSVYSDLDTLITFPAAELYNYTWTSERLNPYRIKIDSLPDSTMINCLDFVYPTESNRITSNFGMRRYRYHYGIDLGLAVGDTVRATFGGTIRIVDYESKGYGHYIVIRHNNGLETVSAHLSKVLVDLNQEVKAGEPIGLGGNTGRSTGPHLHYEIRFLGNAFDPNKLINFSQKSVKTELYCLTRTQTYSHKKEIDALAEARYYKVRSGDTLSKIANRHGTSVSRLCKLNNIRSTSVLRIGQNIRYR